MAQTSITIQPGILKFKMKDTGHTLESLSCATGISTKQISRIRNDGKTTPDSLNKISKALKCQSSELQRQYLVPQHKSWGVFFGAGKHADTDPLLLENGWSMEHINGWGNLENSINKLNQNGIIRLIEPRHPSTPQREKLEWKQGFYHKVTATISSSSDAVHLTIKVNNVYP